MNVNELRQHDAIESVERHQSDDFLLVTPKSDAYDNDDHQLFLWNELNFLREYEDGTLKVPKNNITK